MNSQDLVQQAQDKKYVDFDKTTKDILAQKVAQKLDQDGYFKKLDQARGISEEDKEKKENPFAKKKGVVDAEGKDDEDEDTKGSKDSKKEKKENPFAKKDD